MEEVDRIIIQSLISIGCEITPEITRVSQLTPELFIESVAKLLNSINPGNEPLPIKLPPNTGVKFRICTKFATICQQIGYKNEIGYQTFLYLNEGDTRRLLMFLVEKLSKDVTSSGSTEQTDSLKKSKSIKERIAENVKESLNRFWIPPYCKLNSLRIQEDGKLTIEGSKPNTNLRTIKLAYPENLLNGKGNHTPESKNYYENHCLYVTEQVKRQAVDVITSLMQQNTQQRLKEQNIFKEQDTKLQPEIKKKALNYLKDSLKSSIKRANDLIGNESDSSSVMTYSDLVEIDMHSNRSNKPIKGSRFTHNEKLQFTQEESETVSVITSSTEEKREEEIKTLKEKLEDLNKDYDGLNQEIKSLNALIQKTEEDCKQQTELNKKIEESINIKQRTVNLINDAPQNIAKLKDEINSHENKMDNIVMQWNNHKLPLEEERERLKQALNERKLLTQQKLEDIKLLRSEIEELNAELTAKDNLVKELNKDFENLPKESIKTSNRQFYTKRILEIVVNIDKQKKEIDKILIETKSIQKEINQLSGKLERIFNATDELIFKDAKKDETNKKVYKLFININDSYEQLLTTIEESSHIERDIRDLEDQINTEAQNKTADNLEMVLKDYKQIKEENEQLTSKNKNSK